MARSVEPSERRDDFGRAARAVISRGGLEALTMGNVAHEAGTSVGMLQHYFSSKDKLLLYAHEGVTANFDRWLASVPRDGPVGVLVFKAILRLLPIDTERLSEVRIRLAFIAAGANDSRLNAHQADRQYAMRRLLVGAIEHAKATGEVAGQTDADSAAIIIVSIVNGLGSQMITDPVRISPAIAVETTRAHLSTVFIGTEFADH